MLGQRTRSPSTSWRHGKVYSRGKETDLTDLQAWRPRGAGLFGGFPCPNPRTCLSGTDAVMQALPQDQAAND